MLSLYTDECVPAQVVRGVRRRSVDVVTVGDLGLLGAQDSLLVERARHMGRVLVTYDDDFLARARSRLALGASFPGLIFVVPRTPLGTAVKDIAFFATAYDPSEFVDHIEWIPA
jgi:hypothetical protein